MHFLRCSTLYTYGFLVNIRLTKTLMTIHCKIMYQSFLICQVMYNWVCTMKVTKSHLCITTVIIMQLWERYVQESCHVLTILLRRLFYHEQLANQTPMVHCLATTNTIKHSPLLYVYTFPDLGLPQTNYVQQVICNGHKAFSSAWHTITTMWII